MNVVVWLFFLGVVLVAFSARPDPIQIVSEKTIERYDSVFFSYSVIRYPARLEVVSIGESQSIPIGINLETSVIDFGSIISSGSSRKQLNLTSKDGMPSKVVVKAYGSIASLLSFNSDFVFSSQKSLDITANAWNMPTGNYSGEIDIIVQRSRYDFFRQILGY